MSVDLARVFRILTTVLGLTAIVAVIVGLVGPGGDAVLLLGLACALLSLVFRLAARTAGGPSRDRVTLVGSWVIVVVLGALLGFFVWLIWALDDGLG